MKQTTLSKIIISAIVIVMMVALSSCNALLEYLGSPNATSQSEQTTIPSTEETQGTTIPREELTTPSGNEEITTPSGDTQGTTEPNEEITTPSDDPTHVHVIVVDEAVEPTCTKAGLTEGKHCSACGDVLLEQIEIPALKHNYTSTLVAPTAKENGYTEHVCSRCGYTRKDIIKTVDFVITRENRAMIGYDEENENLVIPAVFQDGDTWYRVVEISDKAFYGTQKVKSVVLPDSLTSIGKYAFAGCGLTSIIIPDSVTSIGGHAFWICDSLTNVTIGDGVTSIGNSAFYSCDALTSVTIGDSVTSIGSNAFAYCDSLASVTIGNSVTSFGSNAFENSYKLVEVINKSSLYITAGSTNYGGVAYYAKEVHKGTTKIVNQNDYLFYTYKGVNYLLEYLGTDTELILPESYNGQSYEINQFAFRDCTSLTSVTFTGSVTSIGNDAFSGCTSLTSVHITDLAAWCNIKFMNEYSTPLYYVHNLYLNGNLITELVIPDGVTSISDYAFNNCTVLTSVVIPDGVTRIGKYAFNNCSSLTSVVIPDIVAWGIGSYAFYGCNSITTATMPTTAISAIPKTNLKTVVLIGGTSIDKEAFYNYTSLTSVTIPDSVTSIGNSAFRDCISLTSVTIGNSVTSIGNGAFEGCYKLIEVINKSSLTIIAGSNEYGYVACYAIEVHKGTTKIVKQNDYLFYTCNGVNYLFGYKGMDTELTLPESYNGQKYVINQYAFYSCDALTSVTIGNSVTSIGSYAFEYCTSLTSVHITDLAAWCNINFSHYSSNPLYYAHNLYLNGNLITELVIPDSVARIGDHAFNGCRSLTSVTIPDSVTSIGNSAFSDCTSLTRVTIPDSVTSIGNYAFYECASLKSITIPDSVTSIGGRAFYNCTALTSVTIGEGVTSIWDRAFYGCDNITTATMPTIAISVIPKNNLVTVVLTSGTSIDKKAFYNCTALTSVTIGDGVTSIGDDAFYNCTSLTSVNITDLAAWCNIKFNMSNSNPLYYAHNLYLNGNLITELVIPGSVTSIGKYAFYSCDALTSVTIGDNVTSIDGYAFEYCTSLTSLVVASENPIYYSDGNCIITRNEKVLIQGCNNSIIPQDVTSIGSYAFHYCKSLTSVTIPDSVTSIDKYAFYYCTSLKSITIGNNVTSIGYYAFEGCTSLKSITFEGTIAQWNAIRKGSSWNSNVPATKVICSDGTVKL